MRNITLMAEIGWKICWNSVVLVGFGANPDKCWCTYKQVVYSVCAGNTYDPLIFLIKTPIKLISLCTPGSYQEAPISSKKDNSQEHYWWLLKVFNVHQETIRRTIFAWWQVSTILPWKNFARTWNWATFHSLLIPATNSQTLWTRRRVKTKALDNKWKLMEWGKLLVHALHAE